LIDLFLMQSKKMSIKMGLNRFEGNITYMLQTYYGFL